MCVVNIDVCDVSGCPTHISKPFRIFIGKNIFTEGLTQDIFGLKKFKKCRPSTSIFNIFSLF